MARKRRFLTNSLPTHCNYQCKMQNAKCFIHTTR
jgi:hypothetical protein